jgi:hypothetical protein
MWWMSKPCEGIPGFWERQAVRSNGPGSIAIAWRMKPSPEMPWRPPGKKAQNSGRQ